ncbi:cardiomyopathy-associated protein 5 [Tympanuchus pallidicinctus]|uniref:cardiomyopathy-associated protein 5 n=1 Tax=Tympanuchus pallidicinctus TaxID=109042 RepID=UPI0022874C64|nr:cardiomyopathy-associated protein 5 [Tympanuchus pallidicinctus]
MEGYHGAECDRASETSSFIEDEEEEEEEEDEEEEDEEAVDPEEAEELTHSLKDLIQSEDVKPKMQYIMTNPSFSMVTVQSEDSGITWETSSSRCSTPWTSETSTTSDLYSMESSPVGSPPGKVIFIMDEGKIVRKRKRKPSSRMPLPTHVRGGQGNKKRDSSGMQRQEPRTVLGDVQDSVLNVELMEAHDTDEEMLEDEEDLENISEQPVKRAPIRSIFRESRLRKVGPILGGPVKSRIQLFNSIFGGTGPLPETLEKSRIQRKSSVPVESECFLEASVKERSHRFISEATHKKSFQRTSRSLETSSERRRNQRQQSTAHSNQSYSSVTPLEKQFTSKDVSFQNIKPVKTKDKPSKYSKSGEETTFQHKERKDGWSQLENLNQESRQSQKFSPPEVARKQHSYSYSPAASRAITEQLTTTALESDDKSDEQVSLPSNETANKKPDQSLLTASDLLDEPKELEIQPSSTLPSVSADAVNKLDRQSTQPAESTLEHLEKEVQKSAAESYLPNAPLGKPSYATPSETRQEHIMTQSSETAQSESEHMLLSHSLDVIEKQETEYHSSAIAQAETEHSGLLCSVKKKESQRTPLPEMQNVYLEKQTESEQDLFFAQEAEQQVIKLNSHTPEKMDSKYFGISYPVCTETQETQKRPVVYKAKGLDHPVFSVDKNNQAESAQMEMEYTDFSYSSGQSWESERPQTGTEHPDFSFSKEVTEDLGSAQLKTDNPHSSYSGEETGKSKSSQGETEQPDFSFSREKVEESESTQLESEYPEFLFSKKDIDKSESPHQETEYPDFSYSREDMIESKSTQLEMEQPDFSFSRKEVEHSESAQSKIEHPDFSYSREEVVESEDAHMKMEQPDFSLPREEKKELESTPLETTHPEFDFSKEDVQELESTQMETERPDFSYSREEMVETENAQLEQTDFSFPGEEREESESAQLETEHQDFSFSKEETGGQKSIPFELEQPKSYSPEEAEQERTAQLELEPSDISYLMEEAEKEDATKLELVHPDIYDLSGRDRMQQMGNKETKHSNLPYPQDETKHQDLAEVHIDKPLENTGKMEQENRVQRGLEELVEIQPKATQEELDYSDLPEIWGKVETQDIDQMNLAQQEITEPELEHPPVPYSFSELMQEEKKIEPAYPERTFYASIDMQEEVTQQKTKQPFISCFTGKTEQDEIMHPEQEQVSVPFSSGKEAPLEMKVGTEYPDLSYSSHGTEQEKFRHPTLPFGSKEQETPSVIEHPDLSCKTGELKPGDTIQGSEYPEYPEKSYSMEEMQQESEYLDSPETLGRAQDQTVEVESDYPNVSCPDGQKSQQETSQLVSKYPDTLFSFSNFKEQATQEFDSKHEDFPRVTRKGDLPGSEQIDSRYPDLTFSSGKAEEPEIAQSEARHSDLSHSTSETNKQEAALLDQKHRKISVDREKQQHTPEEQVEQENSSSKTEQLKYAEDCFEKQALLFSTVRPHEKMALTETEHADVIYPLEKAEVQQRVQLESEQMDLTYPFEKAEQKITQPEVESSNLAHSMGTAELEEIAEREQRYPDLPYPVFQVGKLQSEELKPEHPGLACSFKKLQEGTQLNVLDAHGKTEKGPLAKLELGNEYLASPADKVGQQGMMHTLECPDENQSASRAEHPQPTDEKPGVTDMLSDSGKEEQRGMAKPALKHPDFSYSIHGTQPQKNTQLELGKPDLATWPGKTEQAQHAQKEQSGFLHSFNKEEAQPEMGCSQLSYSVSEIEQEIAHEESIHSALSAGRLEEHEFIQPEAEIMDLSCSVGETQQTQIDELDLEYPDLSHSTRALQKQEEIQPGLEEPSDFSSSLRKEQRMQAEPSEFQCSVWKADRLQDSQVESECKDLSFSVSPAEAHETTKSELKELDLLHSFIKTKQSLDSPEPDHLNVSNAMAKVPHLDSFSSTSEEKQSAHVDFKQERESYALHTEGMAKLKLEQPTLSSAHGTVEQPGSTSMEGEFLETLYFSGEKRENEKEKQDMSSQELEHSGLLDSTDKTQQQEITQPELGQLDLSSYSGKKEQLQTVHVEGVHQELLRFPGETYWQGTAQPEVEHSDLSHATGEVEQPQATQWKSEQPVTPPHTGTTDQRRMARSVQDIGKQDFIYDSGKTDEIQTVQGELEHTASLYSSDKKEQEMVMSELQHPQLSYSVRAVEEKTAHQKSDNKDSSYSTCHQEHHKIVQPEMEEMDLSYPTDKPEQSQSAQIVLQKPAFLKSFGKLEEKGLAQLSFLHSLGEENQKPSSQLDLTQPYLSHLLDKAEKQETAQEVFMSSDFSYSMGKADQLQTEQVKYPYFSCSLDKAETRGVKPLGLLSTYSKADQTQTAHLEHPETSHFAGETEQRNGTHPELQCFNLPPSAVEAEQQETLSVSDTSARTEEQQTAELKSEQSDILNSTEKIEKHKIAVSRAGHSEKRNTGIILPQTTPLETEQDISCSNEEATSQTTQPCSSLPEKSVSVPLGVSYSETKMERNPKSSRVPGGLSSEHLDLSYSQCKTVPSETAQPVSGFFTRKEAENTRLHLNLPVAAQSEAEHVILPETEREQTPQYFHTTPQLESEHLNMSYYIDKTETLESQEYLSAPSKLGTESSAPFYSVDETHQQEIPPYSKPASENLVAKYSLAEQQKQSMQLAIPQSAQSECKYVIPPHDEAELQKNQLYSPKPASLKTEEFENKTALHTKERDEQDLAECLSLEQLSSPKLSAKWDKQEVQPDTQKVPQLVSTELKATAVADQQSVSSDTFVPFHALSEKTVSVAFTDDEEKQNIPSSLANIAGIPENQTNRVSRSFTKEEDGHEMQPNFTGQKHSSLQQLRSVSSDLVYDTVAHKTQHYSCEQGTFYSMESKSTFPSSNEKQNPDIPSPGLPSWVEEEVKAHSINPIKAKGVDKLSRNRASDFGSKQFPAGNFTEVTVHGTTDNNGNAFRVSDSETEISYGLSSETCHRTGRHDLPSPGADNPGPDKGSEGETRFGNPTKRKAAQHLKADKMSNVPEHYLRREEEEMKHMSTAEDSQHAPEPIEQKDLFNIISEGYEILNIHAPTHISSIDQEESKHMPDKLEYLETNPSFKKKIAHERQEASVSGTTEISGISLLGLSESHKVKELVKTDDDGETGEIQEENPVLSENRNHAVLDPDNGISEIDYFEKYTLIDDKSPMKPYFERPSSSCPVKEDLNEPAEQATSSKETAEEETLEEEFALLEDLDEVFYGTVKGESKMQSYVGTPEPFPLQKSIDISSKKSTSVEDEQKSPGTPLFDSEEGVLERSLLFPTTVAAVNPELLEEPPALSFLYKDLYAEAVGEKTKGETPSDEESGNSNASFPSRNSDTDDGTGIYFEKYILKDEIPGKVLELQEDQMQEDESFSGGISVPSSEEKYKQRSDDVLRSVRTEILPERDVVEKVHSDIKATICKPTHAIPFGGRVIVSGARSDVTEQREENVPVETTEELPEQTSQQEYSQIVDSPGAAHQEFINKQEEHHEITAVPQVERYVRYTRTPVEDSEDDQYTQEILSHVHTIQQREKPDFQREEQHPRVYEDFAESMDYDVITQEELLQDEISSELTHEELLFEERDSFEHIGDSYEFFNEPEQKTPVELEDSGFVVMYPEKSAANIPEIESPQRESKKAQIDTYCYNCKCPISAIDKLFGEHKDHEVTTLDDAATKMKDQLGELLIALEKKSMKIEEFVSDIESLFNSVEENCKKNAELLEKQNEEMLKKMVTQYDEKSENFEEVKKMKMEYLYEQMVNFQQTVDSAKETLETTVKEMEELNGFVFLNSSKELNKRLCSAMDATRSLEKVPSTFSLFEHYEDSPGKSNQNSLKHVAVPQTPTLIPQEPNSATSTSIAVYWTVNEGDAIDCFQVYCMEELQASKDEGGLVEEYRVTVKESHCILEDLEPDRCYSVWVMAVNCTGCSLPSEKAIFKTAPATPTIKAEDCTVCWDTATIRWQVASPAAESFTLEYCRQHSPEGEGLRSFAGIKKHELKVFLEPNVNYFFYLRAVNTFGTSEQSEAALISTKGTRFHILSDTAHPALQISPDETVICLPEKATFTGFPSVLGEPLPARGCHYWETVVTACRSYRIGICYETTPQSSVVGPSDTSWCMYCCPTQTSFLCRFFHMDVMSDVHVTEQLARIGILLDYSGGRLLFFNADRGLVLFTIRHKFTDIVYPAFALEKAGMLTLHTGIDLPEFVKHS